MSYAHFIAADTDLNVYSSNQTSRSDFFLDEGDFLSIMPREERFTAAPFAPYVNCPVIADLWFGTDFHCIEEKLYAYVKEAMKENTTVELWYTWNYEDENTERIVKHINQFTIEDLRWLYGDEFFTHTKGLKLFRYTRGKK